MLAIFRSRDWKRYGRIGLCGLLAMLTTTAASVQLNGLTLEESSALYGIGLRLAAFARSWGNTTAGGFLLFLALWFLYRKMVGEKFRFLPSALVLAVLFSLFLVGGRSYELADSWDLLFANSYQMMLALLMFLGYAVFFYLTLTRLFLWLDRRAQVDAPLSQPLAGKRLAVSYAVCLGILLAFWAPYLILCYPGSVSTDGIYQLGQAIGAAPATNHHPWFSSLLMGMFCQGGNWEVGIYLYVLLQSLVCAAAFAGICVQLRRMTGSWVWPTGALLFYGIVPTWGGYAQTYIKDTLFYGVFAGFFLCAIVVIQRRGRCGWPAWVGLFLLGLLGALLRNNGLYVAVPSLLCMAVVFGSKRARVTMAAFALGILALYSAWGKLLPLWGVEPGSVREMLSLPFQQTARYVRECGEEMTPQQLEVVSNVLDLEAILERYDPRVADPVKNTYHGDSQDLKAYFGLWLECGLKRPDIYVEATLDMVFGYFLPGYRYGSYGGNYFLMEKPQYGVEAEFAHPTAVNAVDQFSRLWSKTPGLLLLNAPGTHSWLLILCTTALLRRKKWVALTGTLPIWLTLGICCVSPVNGLVRYMLPIMACMPLLLGFVWTALREKKTEKEMLEHG